MSWEPKYVTLVSGESPCRGLDGLADGFMRWLGKERVRLHLNLGVSANISEFDHLRPVYDWHQAQTHTWEAKETELLVISTRQIDFIKRWVEDQGMRCPVATLDPRDKPCDEVETLTPISEVQVAFKTELPYTADSKTETYPCPYGLTPEERPSLKPYAERTIPVLFAGGATNLTRRVVAEALRFIPGSRVYFGTDQRLTRQEYLNLLADTKVAVACYGAGFGSYRYWEIPYYGALLVAQPPPILIPRNFQKDHQAMFYLSPQEAVETVSWALAHEAQSAKIAAAGTAHLMAYHLSTHRAQWVATIMGVKAQEALLRRELVFPW